MLNGSLPIRLAIRTTFGSMLGATLIAGCSGEEATQRVLGFPLEPQLAPPGWTLVDAFPYLRFNTAVGLFAVPHSEHLVVLERDGKIYAFSNELGASDKRLILDLSQRTQGKGDGGLLGLAFHPKFNAPDSADHSYVYVHYAYTDRPSSSPKWNQPTHSRLSRFTLDPRTLVIAPHSEAVLIDQTDESTWHQGGAMFFHPKDGFLYLAVGDEGGSACEFQNCQRIDKDLFSGVLRIDVDQRGGDVSHPIVRQPEGGATGNYYIPNNNPFVGQTSALEELFAIGLRSPHKMTHDSVDDLTWIGDVGDLQGEEIDILDCGANYQWPVKEGLHPAFGTMPRAPIGIWTDPVYQVPRQDGRAIIGGYVYRGQQFPQLQGKYLFGDYGSGNIWALPYEHDGGPVTAGTPELLLQSSKREVSGDGLTSFGLDAQGEVYMMTVGSQRPILRLARSTGETNLPRRLSEATAFSDVSTLSPDPELLPYVVRSPLYSDGASKQRWMMLPEGGQIEFAARTPWTFPTGTLFVKHFEMALDERAPSQRTRLETRILVAGSSGYYGATYRWDHAGTDAELVLEGQVESLAITEASGVIRTQPYFFPGPGDCMQCHNEGAGFVLGVRTAQLNGSIAALHGDGSFNQLVNWSNQGLFTKSLPVTGVGYPQLAGLDEETRSAEERVRSYWDSNCSMCHGVTDINAVWDARITTPLAQQGVVMGTPYGGAGPNGIFLVTPGDPANSLMYQRSVSNEPEERMPPLGRNRTDARYIEVLKHWIASLESL